MVVDELTRLAGLGHEIGVQPDATEFLVRQGYHRTLGARPMRMAVERFLQEAIVDNLLRGVSGSGVLTVDSSASRLVLANGCGEAVVLE